MRRWAVTAGAALLAAGAAAQTTGGYLDRPFDWRAVLDKPPAPASAAEVADRNAYVEAGTQVDGPAWRAAVTQLYPDQPPVVAQFACAAGHALSPATTPVTLRMLKRLAAEVRAPVEAAKTFFHRNRPYVGDAGAQTCDPRTTPAAIGALSFAYPSGHATFGELWGRALAAADPVDASRIMALGQSVGTNRVACRVHYPSDVAAGQKLADAMFAKIAVTPAFQADLAAVKAELATAPLPADCPTQ